MLKFLFLVLSSFRFSLYQNYVLRTASVDKKIERPHARVHSLTSRCQWERLIDCFSDQ